MKNALFIGHLGMGDQFYQVGIIRYLRKHYDNVYVVCKDKTLKNMKQMYSDDSNILFIPVKHDGEISIHYGCPQHIFAQYLNRYKINNIFCVGFHKHGLSATYPNEIYDLPFSFYNDINIPVQSFWEDFEINKNGKEEELYNILKQHNIEDYVFIHNSCSSGDVFKISYIENNFNLDKNNILFVNPIHNVYEKNHKFYEVAQKFVFKNILEYTSVIENANHIFVSDSGFFGLVVQLPIKTNNCYYLPRTKGSYGYNYEHWWSDKYKSKNSNKKRFKLLKI
tara:strand:- start:1 stop:840 length:840 start_codon:yes stop_codon:yes gene_type:complete